MKFIPRAVTFANMRTLRRKLPPALITTLLLVVMGCSIPSQARPATSDPLAPDPTARQPRNYYEAQLVEMPLRVQSYDMTGNRRQSPVVIREMHVIHDNVRDEILIVDADNGQNHLWSINAYDFTVHWKTRLDERVNYDPVATENYIHLMNSDGLYQGFDRLSSPREGESRLVARGRFHGELFPSAAPASNDSHIFVPATNSNALRGLAMSENAEGTGGGTWTYPDSGDNVFESFQQISMKPAADGETVVFINNNNHLYMIDAQNGDFRASADLAAHSRTPPVIKDDLVFVGSDIGQVYAWERSGVAAWTVTVEGLPYGEIFVEDNWVFVRTLEIYDEVVKTDDGDFTRTATRPGKLAAYQYEVVNIESDRPIYNVIDGNPDTPYTIEPMWTEPDVGQEVLMVDNNRVYVLYEEKEEFLSDREKAKLKSEGRIVTKEDELRTVSRRLRILDLQTGDLLRPEWNMNLADFEFVRGSMFERDRAIYLGTKDGYVFKVYGDGGSAGGN